MTDDDGLPSWLTAMRDHHERSEPARRAAAEARHARYVAEAEAARAAPPPPMARPGLLRRLLHGA